MPFKINPNIDLALTMEAIRDAGITAKFNDMSPSQQNTIINNFAVFKGRRPRGPGNRPREEARGGPVKKYAKGGGVRKPKTYG